MKDAFVRARIESDLKDKVEAIFQQLGLSTTDAIRLFYYQVALRHGLPFPIALPNEETMLTFEATDKGEGLTYCDDADDMFKRLGI